MRISTLFTEMISHITKRIKNLARFFLAKFRFLLLGEIFLTSSFILRLFQIQMWIFSTTKRHLPFGCSCFKSQREKSKTIAPMASIAGLLRFQNPNGKIYCGNSMYKIPQAEQMFQIPTGKVKTFSCWSLNIKFSVFQIPMGRIRTLTGILQSIQQVFKSQREKFKHMLY